MPCNNKRLKVSYAFVKASYTQRHKDLGMACLSHAAFVGHSEFRYAERYGSMYKISNILPIAHPNKVW